jgi:hypothetical protein
MKNYYNVVREFDPCKDYGIKVRKQFVKCLSVLKQGQKINPDEFIKEHCKQAGGKSWRGTQGCVKIKN